MTPTSASRYALSVSLALAASLRGGVAGEAQPTPWSLRDAVAAMTPAQASELGSEEGVQLAALPPRAQRIVEPTLRPPCTVTFGGGNGWERAAFPLRTPAPATVYGPLPWDRMRLRARATVDWFLVGTNQPASTSAGSGRAFAGPVARFNNPGWTESKVSVGAALLMSSTGAWRRLAMELPFRLGDPWALTTAQRWRLFRERGAAEGGPSRIGYREMTTAQQHSVRRTLEQMVRHELEFPRGTELPQGPRPIDAPTAAIIDVSVEFDVYLPGYGWLRLGEGTSQVPLTRTYAPNLAANL